jgi:hypothetical protein
MTAQNKRLVNAGRHPGKATLCGRVSSMANAALVELCAGHFTVRYDQDMREYMVEAGCVEDFAPLKKRLSDHGFQYADANPDWIEESVDNQKMLDGLYLSVQTDRPKNDLESVFLGQGWVVSIKADRVPPSYPA